MPNRLAHETSPYLLQHADNPVDWWPWSADAFEEAGRRTLRKCDAERCTARITRFRARRGGAAAGAGAGRTGPHTRAAESDFCVAWLRRCQIATISISPSLSALEIWLSYRRRPNFGAFAPLEYAAGRGIGGDVRWGAGNAADAACVYFEEIANLLDSAADSFDSLKANYAAVANLAYGMAESVKAGLMFISDLAIEAFIEFMAGLAAAETGVGLIGTAAAWALVAKNALKAVEKYEKIVKAIDVAMMISKAGYAECGRESAGMEAKVKKFPFPGKSYDNAVV